MSLSGDLMTRRKLTYGEYRAIAVDAIGIDLGQFSLRQVYSQLRTSQRCEAQKKPALRLQLRRYGNGKCKYQGHTCRLFAVNSGRGIRTVLPKSTSSLPTPSSHNNIANYSFVLVTNGCEEMDNCITQMEDELGLKEMQTPFGYNDYEIRKLIQTRFR
jgi:hypothetical protein